MKTIVPCNALTWRNLDFWHRRPAKLACQHETVASVFTKHGTRQRQPIRWLPVPPNRHGLELTERNGGSSTAANGPQKADQNAQADIFR